MLYNGSFRPEFGAPEQYPIAAAYASRLSAALLKAVGGDEGAEMVARWADLPDDVNEPQVVKNDSDSDPVMRLAVTSDRMSAAEITDYVDRYVVDHR